MKEPRLRPKYMVYRIDEEATKSSTFPVLRIEGPTGGGMSATDPEDVDSPFVLMPRKDPAAYEAMVAYMSLCEPQLAGEIHAWLRKIADSEPVYGTQGKRNRAAIRLLRLSGAR